MDLADLAAGKPSDAMLTNLHRYAWALRELLDGRCQTVVVDSETLFTREIAPV
jgi:hypothetical protein